MKTISKERKEELAGIIFADPKCETVTSQIQKEVERARLASYSGADGIKEVTLRSETLKSIKDLSARIHIPYEECVEFFKGIVIYNVRQIV